MRRARLSHRSRPQHSLGAEDGLDGDAVQQRRHALDPHDGSAEACNCTRIDVAAALGRSRACDVETRCACDSAPLLFSFIAMLVFPRLKINCSLSLMVRVLSCVQNLVVVDLDAVNYNDGDDEEEDDDDDNDDDDNKDDDNDDDDDDDDTRHKTGAFGDGGDTDTTTDKSDINDARHRSALRQRTLSRKRNSLSATIPTMKRAKQWSSKTLETTKLAPSVTRCSPNDEFIQWRQDNSIASAQSKFGTAGSSVSC